MLKFLKIFPFVVVCFSCLKAQKDTFFLDNKQIYTGKIYKDNGDELDIDCEYGPMQIKTNKLYKIVYANGKVIKYKDLTYLETGLSRDNYLKLLKPLTVKGMNLYYGGIHLSRRNFFDALEAVGDEEINTNINLYRKKNKIGHVLVPTGWCMQTAGFVGILLFAPDLHFRNHGLYYYDDQTAFILYGGGALILTGITEVTIGYIQAAVAEKIKKRKLIRRYNSLILQP